MGAWEGMISAESGIASRCAASGTDSMASEWSQLSDIDSSDSLWSLEGEKGESLFLNLEELEGRDDVKGINRAKKERERAHSSVGRERERKGATASRMDQLEWREKREKLPPFPVLTLQCFLTAREGLRERLERDGLVGVSRQKEIEGERKGMGWRARLGGSKGASLLPAPHSAHPLAPSQLPPYPDILIRSRCRI